MTFRLSALLMPALALGLAACPADDDDTSDDTDTDGPGETPDFLDCTDGLNEGSVCRIVGNIEEDFALTADVTWVLDGGIFVGNDDDACPTLTIDAGTTIFGSTGTDKFLAIQRCARIEALGTADAPVVFTSSKEEGERAPSDWGGLIINGAATSNACPDPNDCNLVSEGGAGLYGGNDDSDDSGILNYVTVAFAGSDTTTQDQLNGIAFQAVGDATEVDYIQVHLNLDDGVEFFGGTVNAKHVVVTGANDDSIDWTDGWRGKLQHGVVHQWAAAADNGMEMDNNGDDNTLTPRSKPTVSHVTVIGAPDASDCMRIREGTAGNFYSMLLVACDGQAIDIRNEETYANAFDGTALTNELTIDNSLIVSAEAFNTDDQEGWAANAQWDVATWYNDLNSANRVVEGGDPLTVIESLDEVDVDWQAKGDATSGGAAPSDSFFDRGTHVGGVAPGDEWYAGWIVTAPN